VVDRGSIDIPDLAKLVGTYDSVLLRVALIPHETEDGPTGKWLVTRGELILDAPDEGGQRLWRYPTAVFLERSTGGDVAAALVSGETQEVDGLTIVPAATVSNATMERIPGQRRWNDRVTPWPRTEWQISPQANPNSRSDGILIGGGPSHLNYEAAASAFFDAAPINHNRSSRFWTIIRHDRKAWFRRITITASRLSVHAEGDDLSGVTVELTTPSSNMRLPMDEGRADIELRDGFPQHSLLILRSDSDWLDHRYFDNLTPGQQRDSSVVWDQPGTELEILLAGGEGQYVEFKELVPQGKETNQERETKRKLLKTVAAFASWNSGTVLVGVNDDGVITGIPRQLHDELGRMVTSLIRSNISPEPLYSLTWIEHDGKYVLRIDVEGQPLWHCLDPNKPQFYVRRNGSTVYAMQDEIAAGFLQVPNPSVFGR
jgi:hypothetical protein